MGIYSLTSLVNHNSHLVEDFKLRNTRVVVDGTNLIFGIYRSCRIDCCFGGEFKTFEKECKCFFVNLRLCNVEPVVIFDGALDVQDLKQQTRIKRAMSRLNEARTMASGYASSYSVVPMMTENVFKNVLKMLNIEFYQCAGEADAYIASEANRLSCPVISQDSDFYIFDLAAGYLSFDAIEWREIQEFDETSNSSYASPYLAASIYHLKNLLDCFTNLNRDVLPMFATLMGNDFIKSSEFANFLDQVPKETTKRCSETAGTKRHNNMIGVLKWLQGKTVESAILGVLETTKKENREKLRSSIERSVAMYKDIGVAKNRSINNDECRNNLEFLHLPDWFLDAYSKGLIPPSLISILTQRPMFLWTMIEDFNQSISVFRCCRSIRQAAYAVLLRDEPACLGRSAYEYVRQGGALEKQEIPYDESYAYLPSLKSVESVDLDTRKRYYYSVIQFAKEDLTNLHKFPTFLTQYLCSLTFWARSNETCSARYCFDALVTCLYFRLLKYCVDETWQKSTFCPPAKESDDEKKFEAAMKTFEAKPKKAGNTKTSYRPTIAILHSFSQWQAVAYSLHLLRAVLNLNSQNSDDPFGYFGIENYYSGHLCYNLAKVFSACSDFESGLNKLFSASTNVTSVSETVKCLRRFHAAIYELIGQRFFVAAGAVGGRAARRSKNSNKKKPVLEKRPSVEIDGETVEIKERETDVVDWSDNKFAALRSL